MDESQVKAAIDGLIERKEKRIQQVQDEIKSGIYGVEQITRKRILIGNLDHSINTLLELEHNLRLCDCPDEAYEKAEQV